MSIRILHFSDLHLSGDAEKQINTSTRLGFLFNSIVKLQESDGKRVDIVVFTGDLIDKGGKDFSTITDGFQAFKDQVLTPLTDKAGIQPDRIVFLPGNHDTQSSDIKEMRDKRNLLEDYPHSSEREINSILNISNGDKELVIKRTKEFKRFELEYFSHYKHFFI